MSVVAEIASLKSCIEEVVYVEDAQVSLLVSRYLEDSTIDLPEKLEGQVTVKIQFDAQVAMMIHISKDYPEERPQVTVHGLTDRGLQSEINRQVQIHLDSESQDQDTILYDLVSLIRTALDAYNSHVQVPGDRSDDTPVAGPPPKLRQEYGRIMFYAHHLLAVSKRKDIQRMSKELDMNIICKTGYPGLIAAEGTRFSLDVFVREIKSMRWHTIGLKYEIYQVLQIDETWRDRSKLKKAFLETTEMSAFAKSLEDDKDWMQSIIH